MASARTGGALVSSLGWSWEDTEEKGLAAESQERDARVSWVWLVLGIKGGVEPGEASTQSSCSLVQGGRGQQDTSGLGLREEEELGSVCPWSLD
jgi:hypothetical protein